MSPVLLKRALHVFVIVSSMVHATAKHKMHQGALGVSLSDSGSDNTATKDYFYKQAKEHSRAQLTQAQSKYEVSFVHATKTGGTAIQLHMMAHGEECPHLNFFVGHSFKELELQEHGFHTLIVMRDPADRIRSAFDYSKYGSGFHPDKVDAEAVLFLDANHFVDALRDRNHTLHNKAWHIVDHREEGDQFAPEEYWLNGDSKQRSVVCYSADLGDGLSAAVNRYTTAGSKNSTVKPCDLKVPRSNVSKQHSEGLTEMNANWVRLQLRSSDYHLWGRYCGPDVNSMAASIMANLKESTTPGDSSTTKTPVRNGTTNALPTCW